ncbi:MAG: hypothetical protein RQ758_02485 [Methanomicrobiaceae archaeon]|nr:hypothetical protein [Methanomicrobiaceae archaeon]
MTAARAAGCDGRIRVLRVHRISVREFVILPCTEDLIWIDPVLESITGGQVTGAVD